MKAPSAPHGRSMGLAARTGSDAFEKRCASNGCPPWKPSAAADLRVSRFRRSTVKTTWQPGLVDADYEWVTTQLMAVAQRHCQGRVISPCLRGYVINPGALSPPPRAALIGLLESALRHRLQGDFVNGINITRPRCLPRVRSWCLPAQRKTAHPQPR